MRSVITVFCFLFSLASYAASDLGQSFSESIYEKVSKLFDAGTLMNPEFYVNKAVSGRCFKATSPNTPIGAFFTVGKSTTDIGPIADPLVEYSFAMFSLYSGPPDFFDGMTVDEVLKIVRSNRSQFLELTYVDARTYSGQFAPGDVAKFRQNGSYLVERNVTKGKEDLFCYFYKFN